MPDKANNPAPPATPEIGAMAPDFSLPASGGATVRLSDLRPARVVLYFYPKDDTPGCTVEALDFTALNDAFRAENAVVIGVSRDSVASHDRFTEKHDLGIALVSDSDASLCTAYGVLVEKRNYGRRYIGIERTTFLIDGEGRIQRIWRKVKADGHAREVLQALREG